MAEPTHYPCAPSEDVDRCKWCGSKIASHGGRGKPYFCTVTCSWQFATAVVKDGIRIEPLTKLAYRKEREKK